MGEHCELMAKEWGITREAQDQLAYESHKKAAAAYDEGFMDDLVVPFAGVFRDNNIREDISPRKDGGAQARFRPLGQRARSPPPTRRRSPTGPRPCLLASEEWAAKRGTAGAGLSDLGRTSAEDFVQGEGLLMAPTVAVSEC